MSFDFTPYDCLVAGEQFGVMRDELRRQGMNALSCDLEPDRTGSEHHFEGDWEIAIQAKKWRLVIFHPECTYLCVSGNAHYGEGKPGYHLRLEAVEYTERMWELVKEHSDHAALENPQGVLPRMSRGMGPVQSWVQPHNHGDDASKKTGFHLHNLSPVDPEPSLYVVPRWVCCGMVLNKGRKPDLCPSCLGSRRPLPRWANQTDSGQNRLTPGEDRARQRAATYPGIARASIRTWIADMKEDALDGLV